MPNEYDGLVAQLPPEGATGTQTAANPYDDLVGQMVGAEQAQLRASASIGLNSTPDKAAQVLALSSATRLPADLVERNLPDIQRNAKLQELDLERTQREHPELAGWLANPHNLGLAQDDMPTLRRLDQSIKGLVAGPGDDPFGILPPGFKFAKGGTIVEDNAPAVRGRYATQEEMALGTGVDIAPQPGGRRVYASLQELDAELGRRSELALIERSLASVDQKELQQGFGAASQFVAGAIGSASATEQALGLVGPDEAAIQARQLAAYAALSPGLGGGIQRGIGGLAADLPLMLSGGPLAQGAASLLKVSRARAILAATVGTKAAKYAGSAATAAASVQPLAIREGLNDAQQNGAGSGLVNWLIETAVPGAFGRTGIQRALIPGVDSITKVSGWIPAAKHLLTDAGLEGSEEAATELAHALFESASGQNPNALSADQLLPRLAVAGAVGGLAGAVFTLPKVARDKFEADALQIRQSTVESDSLAAAFDLARASKTAERSPEQVKLLIERQTGTAGTTTFFQSEDFIAHYEAQGLDPEQVAARMGVDESTYRAAVAASAAIPVPTAGFLAHTTEADRPLLAKATMRADGLNREQIATATGDIRTLLQGAVNDAKQQAESAHPAVTQAESSKQAVRDAVEAALIAAGRDEVTARNESLLVSEPLANLAERFNTASRDQAEREALATWKREHSGNQPDRKSAEWKQALEQAQAKAPTMDPHELFNRYIARIQGPSNAQADTSRSMDQPNREQPNRGRIDITENRSMTISLLETADRSTFIHEMGHAYLEILTDLAANKNAPDSILADMATIRAWVGADETSDFTTPQHEQWARGFEAYMMEGKAPSSTLRRAFANFKNWLTKIYRTVLRLNVQLSPEIRGVYDRLLASDAAIERANEQIGNKSPWETAAEAGMTEEQFAKYLAAIDYRKDRAADFVRARLMHEEFQAESDERDRERKQVEEQLGKTLDAQPVYAAIRHLQSGEAPAGVTLNPGAVFKISKDDLLRFYSPEDLARLPGPQPASKNLYNEQTPKPNRGERIYTTGEGISLADAAAVFGFPDGDALIQAMTTAPDRDATLEQQVNDEMARRYPDPLIDGSIDILAKGELADQLAGHVLDQQVKALGAKVGQEPAPTEILKQVAAELIAKTKAANLRPETYWNAARKASREAFAAAAKSRDGKPEQQAKYDRQAFDAAQRERFNLHLYRAAQQAQEDGEKGRKYLAKFDNLDQRQKLGKAGGWEFTLYDQTGAAMQVVPNLDEARKAVAGNIGWTFARTNGYLEQIDNILEGYDLRRVSNAQLRRREALGEWVARQEALGEPVALPDSVIADLGRRNWSDLTVAEQSEIVDAVRNVEHLAKVKARLMRDKAKRELEAASTAMVSAIVTNAPRTIPKRFATTPLEAAQDRIVRYFEDHRKDSFLVREMDGFTTGGSVWEYLIRPRNEAAAEEQTQLTAATLKRDAYFKEWGKKAGILRKDIPGTKLRLTNEMRVGLALNWGNVEGRQRVLMYLSQLGYGETDMQAVLDSLDRADWDLINATWEHLASHWSEIRALEQRTTGLAPEQVEAVPIVTRYGTMAGGYYPIKYDQRLSSKSGDLQAAADAKQALRAAYGANQTKRGHTKQRARNVQGLALRLDFGVVGEHLSEVIHDLTHRELTIDQNRLLRDPALSDAIIKHYGRGALDQLVNTAADIAVGDKPARAASERMMRGVRKNGSASVFGFNLNSALANFTGITQSFVRVGPGYMASAMARVLRDSAHLEASASWVQSKSATMRQRATTQLQHMHEATGRVEVGGTLATIRRIGYYPMTKVQQAVDTLTWIGAYEQSLAASDKAGKTLAEAEADAVAHADQTVLDTQGSARIGDLSAFQRGGELTKLLTSFYSYFNVTFNLQREAVQRLRASPRDASAWLRAGTDTLLIWALPAVLSQMLAGWLRGDKEKDQEQRLKQMALDEVAYGMGMLVGVREVSGAVAGGFGYSGPAGLRAFDVANQAVLQLRQGDLDAGLGKAALAAGGVILGLPAVEAGRIVDAFLTANDDGSALDEFRTAAFGKPR